MGGLGARGYVARRSLNRGEIWHYSFSAPDKRRPVLIMSRQEVIGLLRTVTVAPITSTVRGIHSKVILGMDEGLPRTSAVNLDHLQTIDQAQLVGYSGHLSVPKMRDVCRALAVA